MTAPEVSPRTERTIVVGVDFGTSSTKVIWQDLSDNHFEIVRWSEDENGSRTFLLPSWVVIRGDAIYSGLRDGDLREGDIKLSSVKLCVLCRSNASICRCTNGVVRHGLVRLPGQEAPQPATAFACLFLAHVFHDVERRLTARFPKDDLLLLWNIGCPIDYLDEANRKGEWERMAGVAMEIRHRVSSPASISILGELSARVDSFAVPKKEDRNYFIQPEGLAAVKAFLESPHADPKTYAIVDVGAGTTEVSFFFNGRIMTEKGYPLRPSYLADSTQPIGGGRIDMELAQAWNCTVEQARRRKEKGDYTLPIQSINDIRTQYKQTCHAIFKHHKLVAPTDKQFDLFVIGGGGRLRPLQEALRDMPLPGGFVRDVWRPLLPPKSLKDRVAIGTDYDLLANACGLASSLSWDYYPPHEVAPMPLPPPAKSRPDLDEYYPK